jgi:hypothetical protein
VIALGSSSGLGGHAAENPDPPSHALPVDLPSSAALTAHRPPARPVRPRMQPRTRWALG